MPKSLERYLDLVDWTGRQIVRGNKGRIPHSVAPILARLKLDRATWCELVEYFGKRFFHVAGAPTMIDATPSRVRRYRYYIPTVTRTLFAETKSQPTSPA